MSARWFAPGLVLAVGLVGAWPVRAEAPPPLKLDVAAASESRVKTQAPLQVRLLDTEGRAVASQQDLQLELSIVRPDGTTEKHAVAIKAGQSQEVIPWEPTSTGVTVFKVREVNDRVMDGSDATLVKPALRAKPPEPPPPSPAPKPRAARPRGRVRVPAPHAVAPHTSAPWKSRPVWLTDGLGSTSWLAQGPVRAPVAAAVAPDDVLLTRPHLLLQIQERSTGVLANSADFAKVHVFYVDPRDGGAVASTDIKVWFNWQGGWVDPQPAVIRQGTSEVEARWKSSAAGDATLRISTSAPDLPWSANSEMRVTFVPPIRAVVLNGPAEVSFLDDSSVSAGLVDFDGKPVKAGLKRSIRFGADSPLLQVDPSTIDLAADDFEVRASVRPTRFSGRAEVRAEIAGYYPAVRAVRVTWLAALLSCLAGALAGAFIGNLFARQASWSRALLVGTVVGVVLSLGAELGLFLVFGVRIPKGSLLVPIIGFLGGGGGPAVLSYAGQIFRPAPAT
jgi:hypothetical protein